MVRSPEGNLRGYHDVQERFSPDEYDVHAGEQTFTIDVSCSNAPRAITSAADADGGCYGRAKATSKG